MLESTDCVHAHTLLIKCAVTAESFVIFVHNTALGIYQPIRAL